MADSDGVRVTGWSSVARRRFLTNASMLVGSLALGACGSSGGNSASSTPGPTPTPTPSPSGQAFGLQWPGNGDVRRMLYWDNPFPIYNATYIFRVLPFAKTTESNPRYWTTFFWGNTKNDDNASGAGFPVFEWNNGSPDTYYGAHPYPTPAPMGAQRWEVSVESNDFLGPTPDWGRWHTQVFRAWRESASVTHHEFYYDWPDTGKLVSHTVNDANWGHTNPPIPRITMGQSAWLSYAGNEEFKGVIRGIQFYSGLLSLAEAAGEIDSPMSTTNGANLIWYLNLNPRPGDVTDKKGVGAAHNPSWRGTTALEWAG